MVLALVGDSTITNFISAPPERADDFLILLLLAVAVAIAMSILKQLQIAKKLQNNNKNFFNKTPQNPGITHICDSNFM